MPTDTPSGKVPALAVTLSRLICVGKLAARRLVKTFLQVVLAFLATLGLGDWRRLRVSKSLVSPGTVSKSFRAQAG